jgi:hypothetical protein
MSNPKSEIVKSTGKNPTIASLVSDEKKDDNKEWIVKLYDMSTITNEELKSMYESFAYQGFNRSEILILMSKIFPNHRLAVEAILAVALRGPSAGSKVRLSNNKTLSDMGIPASKGKGTKILTCSRIQAATADLAASMMKKLNVPKRMDLLCPAWLQFPSAGSIKLPDHLRSQHREFAEKFSKTIGGVFNEQIYTQMAMNAYLDETLNLFM